MLRPVPNAPLLLPDASRRLALPGASLLQRARARARLGRTYLAADGASCPRRCSCAPNTPRASARAPLGAALDLANEAAARRSSCWHAWARRGRAHACEFAHSHLFCPGHNGPARYARARRNQQCSTPPHSSATVSSRSWRVGYITAPFCCQVRLGRERAWPSGKCLS